LDPADQFGQVLLQTFGNFSGIHARGLANSDGAQSVVTGKAEKLEDRFKEFGWF
jgi:hypothetical protein